MLGLFQLSLICIAASLTGDLVLSEPFQGLELPSSAAGGSVVGLNECFLSIKPQFTLGLGVGKVLSNVIKYRTSSGSVQDWSLNLCDLETSISLLQIGAHGAKETVLENTAVHNHK